MIPNKFSRSRYNSSELYLPPINHISPTTLSNDHIKFNHIPSNNTISTPSNNTISTPSNTISTPSNNTISTPSNNTISTPSNTISTLINDITLTHTDDMISTPVNDIIPTLTVDIILTPVNNNISTPINDIISTPINDIISTEANDIIPTEANDIISTEANDIIPTEANDMISTPSNNIVSGGSDDIESDNMILLNQIEREDRLLPIYVDIIDDIIIKSCLRLSLIVGDDKIQDLCVVSGIIYGLVSSVDRYYLVVMNKKSKESIVDIGKFQQPAKGYIRIYNGALVFILQNNGCFEFKNNRSGVSEGLVVCMNINTYKIVSFRKISLNRDFLLLGSRSLYLINDNMLSKFHPNESCSWIQSLQSGIIAACATSQLIFILRPDSLEILNARDGTFVIKYLGKFNINLSLCSDNETAYIVGSKAMRINILNEISLSFEEMELYYVKDSVCLMSRLFRDGI